MTNTTIFLKTGKLEGAALDWAVAKCEGLEVMLFDKLWRDNAALKGYPVDAVEEHLQWQTQREEHVIVELQHLQLDQRNPENTTPTRRAKAIPNYSTDWSQGGPIIEREMSVEGGRLHLTNATWASDCKQNYYAEYSGHKWEQGRKMFGPTPLIAAMRCYVSYHMGTEVEIPEELA